MAASDETFRIPPLMPKRTICIRREGGWSGVGAATVWQLNSSSQTYLAKTPNLHFEL